MRFQILAFTFVATLLLSGFAASQQTITKTINVNGVVRQYLVYLPSGYSSSRELPVMFTFHGGSMTSRSMLSMVDMRPLADREKFIAVYPQGLPGKGSGNIWNSVGPYSNGVDEIGFVSAMIDALDSAYAVDTDRVYACGYSNGANLVWELGCYLSHRITAVAAVAGSMWVWTRDSCAARRPVPVLSIHGTRDSYNEYNGGLPYSLGLIAASNYWVGNNKANVTPSIFKVPNTNTGDGSTVEHYKWTNGESCTAVEHFKVINGGHDWPGQFGNMDIDATEEIWKFCSRYDLHGRTDTALQIGVGAGGANIGSLDSLSGPSIGSSVQLNYSSFRGAAPGFLVLSPGASTTQILGGTVFLDLASLSLVPSATGANGSGSAVISVPNLQSLIGLEAYLQLLVTDSTMVAGVALSNGLKLSLCK